MSILKRVESMPTDVLLENLANGYYVMFGIGFVCGAVTSVYAFIAKTSDFAQDYMIPLSLVGMLLLVMLFHRLVRKKVIPEIKRRCQEQDSGTEWHGDHPQWPGSTP